VSSTSLSCKKLFCLSQKAFTLPLVLSYALEEPATKAGKRKLDREVAMTIAGISASKK
jgi:hypothetical protein